MAGRGMAFNDNVAQLHIRQSDNIQEIQLTFYGNNTNAKVD